VRCVLLPRGWLGFGSFFVFAFGEFEEYVFEGIVGFGECEDFLHGAEVEEFAEVDDADVVSDFFCDGEAVGGHEDGEAFFLCFSFEVVFDFPDVFGVEAYPGFVYDDDAGVVEEA